jgi:acetylornithine deacetylase
MNTHLDTVPAGAGWDADPLEPVEENGRIVGLGACDAKGCLASMLCAAARLKETDLGGEVVLALTVEEETCATGQGLPQLLPELGHFDGVVVGEPTGLDVCLAQKGLLVLEAQTAGLARHAAHAHRISGPNAIVEAARGILALADGTLGPSHDVLGPVTCQVTTISGGTRRNIIPDRCIYALDIRTVPGFGTEALTALVESRTGAQVRVISDRFPPFETAFEAPIVQAALRANPAAAVGGSETMSDAVWTRSFPTIKVGPGSTDCSHTAGEFIKVVELIEGTCFYERLIREFLP